MLVTAQMLDATGIKIYRAYVAEHATSPDMAGCSISMVRLDGRVFLAGVDGGIAA